MSPPLTWPQRKAQLRILLECSADDENEGLALDRLLHGQSVVGKSQKGNQVESLRFSDKDINSLGNLASGQFGTVELVSCKLDGRVYVRKCVTKKMALRSREQFSPQLEKQILLTALKENSVWAPRMLCAYQCLTNLNIVMEYAEGGSLWDVIESSPNDGRISVQDLQWWIPQCVSAVHWCHSEGFVHRDIKPHNFVLKPNGHIMLIDFGSAAPLLPARPNGVQFVPKQHCLVPCGTCDYISPEILQAHEEALVALEMSDDEDSFEESYVGGSKGKAKAGKKDPKDEQGYGKETDWWSLGAMTYEMAYGVAPFFAKDIRQTYTRIMGHETSLKFDHLVPVPSNLINLIKGFLTHHEKRLGRHSVNEIKAQPFFQAVDWTTLHTRPAPGGLHLPQFTYTAPLSIQPNQTSDSSNSSADSTRPFAFSALLQSSFRSSPAAPDILATPAFGRANLSKSVGSTQKSLASFIGFSWGPPKDAFDDSRRVVPAEPLAKCVTAAAAAATPSPPFVGLANTKHSLVTPMRPALKNTNTLTAPSTIRVPTSVRRSATQQRPVSDREAMKQLVDCVGMSARKRVLESGKKPRVLLPQFSLNLFGDGMGSGRGKGEGGNGRFGTGSTRSGRPRSGSVPVNLIWSNETPKNANGTGTGNTNTNGTGTGTVRKELRFGDDTTHRYSVSASASSRSASASRTFSGSSSNGNRSEGQSQYITYDRLNPDIYADADGLSDYVTETETEGSDMSSAAPPSPSPSPRPGSAMSMMSMVSRRSGTPTATTTMSGSFPLLRTGSMLMRTHSEPGVGTRFGSLRGVDTDLGRSKKSGLVSTSTPTLTSGTTTTNGAGAGTSSSESLLTPPPPPFGGREELPLPLLPVDNRRVPPAQEKEREDREEDADDEDHTPRTAIEDDDDDEPEIRRGKTSPKPAITSTPRPPRNPRENTDRRETQAGDRRPVTSDQSLSDALVDMHRRYDRLMADIARFRTRLDRVQVRTGVTQPRVVQRT